MTLVLQQHRMMVSKFYSDDDRKKNDNDPVYETREEKQRKRLREYYEYTKVEQRLRMAEREPYGRTRGHEMVRQYLIQTAHRHVHTSPNIIPLTLHTWLHMRYAMKIANRIRLKDVGSNELSRSFLPRSRRKIPLPVAKQIIQDMWYLGRSHLWEDYIQENEKWLEQQRIKALAERQQQQQQQQQQILEQQQEADTLLRDVSSQVDFQPENDEAILSNATTFTTTWNENQDFTKNDFFDR
jgi:hypothetical protein